MEQILSWIIQNWGIVTTVVVALLGALGIFKHIDKAKFIAVWNLIDDVILIITRDKNIPEDQVKVRDIVREIKNHHGIDKTKTKAVETIFKSPEKNEKIVEKVIKARKLMETSGEIVKAGTTAYKLFKGFTKLF